MRASASAGAVVVALLMSGPPAAPAGAQAQRARTADQADRPRLLVLTDISNEPDDEESLVRLLVYANEFDLEGLVATTSTHLRTGIRPDLIQRQVEAYAQVRANLAKHAAGYPEAAHLLGVTRAGQPAYGMAAVGDEKATDGSRQIVEVVDRADARPIWISVWGGANTLAQALWDVKRTRPQREVDAFVSKLRVYSISDQDDAGRWLRTTFPALFYIVSPSGPGWKEYYRATWSGISGDRHYANGPFHKFALVDNPWLEEHVIRNHGPLGALYPRLAYIMEGDTPAFLGLVNNGLGWHVNPSYGGWGGRYALDTTAGETRPIWTNNHDARDTVVAEDGRTYTSAQATIWRWREHFQHDFAARMDWCVADRYEAANHNPVAVLNDDRSRQVLEIAARPGETVRLSAEGSADPDQHAIALSWFVYPEAGTAAGVVQLSTASGERTTLVAPAMKQPGTIHVILQAQDAGTPSLTSYRRAVITVRP